ncbi:MAG TPA: hypothetical protein VFE19_03110 [Jatrophihabitantaceae bacterium]|jgi:hypothetical protein|nr:hypothetical protein [Jatrophihabitantaceae bacterium]
MATIDRIEPAYPAWSPSTSGFTSTDEATEAYVGKHRRPGARGFGILRMVSAAFYQAKHRRH